MLSGTLLSKPEHFSPSVLRALSVLPAGMSEELYVSLLLAALRLEQHDDLATRLASVAEAVCRDDERVMQLTMLTRAVLQRPAADVHGGALTLEGLVTCASSAAASKKLLYANSLGSARLQGMLSSYMQTKALPSWPGLFKAAETSEGQVVARK